MTASSGPGGRAFPSRFVVTAVTVLVTAAVGYALFRIGAATAPPRAAQGSPAPAFTAVTLDAVPQVRTLEDFRGSPILLNVWATWCDPCREEMPSMQRLYEAYRDRGLRVVAISVDDRGTEQLMRDFIAEHHLTFYVLHDQKSEIMTTYQVRGVPQTFLISRAGDIVATRFVADWASPASRQLIDSLFFAPEAAP